MKLIIAFSLFCLSLSAQQIDWNTQIKNKPGAVGFPATSDHIQFVSPNGNDTNDGLSWATAKLTCAAAVAVLSGFNGIIYESPALVTTDCIAGTGSATGVNGFIWSPSRFYIGPVAQATVGNNRNSLELRFSGSLMNGGIANDDFYTFKVFENSNAITVGSDFELNHSSISGGAGRFLINTDTVIGAPGDATAGTNFNSFAGDMQGSYFSGGGSHPVLWEYALTTTPNSGVPINARMNFIPVFPDGIGSNTTEFCIGGTGTLSAVGNYSGVPNFCWTTTPRDGFTATFSHVFTASRSFTYPDAAGILPTLAGTSGQVQFNSGGTNLGADASLFWDNGNKRLGIGQATPLVPFHVKTTGSGGWPQYEVENTATGGASFFFGVSDNGNGAGGAKFLIHHTNSSSGSEITIDSSTSNVGISNTAPAVELDVTGKVNVSVGYRIGNVATSGRYLKGDGTNFIQSSGSASGIGSCANKFVNATNSDAAPSCNSQASDDGTTFSTGSDTLTINGDTAMSAAPRLLYSAYFVDSLNITGRFAHIVVAKNITVTRFSGNFFQNGTTCSTFPVIRVTDGTSNTDATASATDTFDSGAVSMNVNAGASLDIRIQTAETCTVGDFNKMNAYVEYKMR